MKRDYRKGTVILVLVVVFFMAVALLMGCGCNGAKEADKDDEIKTAETGKKLEFVDKGKFGFLTGPLNAKEIGMMKEAGVGWARPHPGPFVWDQMQVDAESKIDFSETDRLVQNAQEAELDLLITLWPFAEWDQLNRPDAQNYQVSPNDEFIRELPLHRGNPVDWEAYEKWLTAVVERYDGDGKNDMEGLESPIRYWEISNEPDLGRAFESNLTFFTGTPEDYAELLKKSYETIKAADPEAQVLIAGAAGGQQEFLDFWQRVIAVDGVRDAFDIGNVHCISGGHTEDFNVSPYKSMMEAAGVTKPIWVTEAENVQRGADFATNASLLEQSVAGAFSAGAEKIFFTHAPLSGGEMKYDPQAFAQEKDIYKNIVNNYK